MYMFFSFIIIIIMFFFNDFFFFFFFSETALLFVELSVTISWHLVGVMFTYKTAKTRLS